MGTLNRHKPKPGILSPSLYFSDRVKLYQCWVPPVSILRPGKQRIEWYETIWSETYC